MTVRDAIVSVAPFLIAAALAFGPIGAWLANARARNPAIWLVLAAITGPVGIALLLAAPPGRCPSCGEPTVGFRSTCAVCGEPTRLARRRAMDVAAHSLDVRATGSTDVVAASWLESGPPAPQGAATDAAAPRARSRSSRSSRPSRSRSPDAGGARLPAGGERLAALGARRPTDAPLRAVGPAPVAPGPSAPLQTIPGMGTPLRAGLSILAIAVYVQGSEKLLPGARYLLARTAHHLVVVGPLEASSEHKELDLPLDGVEATFVPDRLVVSGWMAGRNRRWVLGFQSLAGLSATAIDEALMTDASRVEAVATS